MMKKLRNALVTGASGGIGREIAMRLASDGHRVAVHYNSSKDKADSVVDEINSAGGQAQVFQADMADSSAVSKLFKAVDDEFGPVDVFVNNVGIPAPQSTFEETDEALFDRVFGVNAKGSFFALKAAAGVLTDNGRIINISSSTTYFPTPGLSVYTASKSVLKTYTEILALELGGRGITVNTVAPGPTVPGMFEWASDDLRQHAAALSPFNRLGRPEDVAGAVAFLASDDARWVTGQHLLVNGGATI